MRSKVRSLKQIDLGSYSRIIAHSTLIYDYKHSTSLRTLRDKYWFRTAENERCVQIKSYVAIARWRNIGFVLRLARMHVPRAIKRHIILRYTLYVMYYQILALIVLLYNIFTNICKQAELESREIKIELSALVVDLDRQNFRFSASDSFFFLLLSTFDFFAHEHLRLSDFS